MQVSAQVLSDLLNGTLEGDPQVLVNRPSKIENAKAGSVSFLANPKYEPYVYTSSASVILVNQTFQPARPLHATLIRVQDVYAAIALILEKFGKDNGQLRTGVSPDAFVHTTASIGKGVSIGPFAVVEEGAVVGDHTTIYPQAYVGKNTRIGQQTLLYPGVKIYHECEIGNRCILQANVVIGSDGFGFAPQTNGSFKKIAQIGNVILEDEVEIGANSVVDRATIGSTIIRKGAKLDNLVQIAHNVEIGSNTAIAAQAGVAGSTKIGEQCLIGGQAGFVGHITVANGTKVQAQSGVAASIKEPNKAVYGSPALDYQNYLRSYAVFKQLPDLYKRIAELEKKLGEET